MFEGGLLLVAFVLGWILNVNPTAGLKWSLQDFVLGLAATIPLLFLLVACLLMPARGMQQIRVFLRDAVGPLLNRCNLLDLFLLSLLAGLCEEILFRGLLFEWISGWNTTLAIMVTNLLFGVAHAITPLYAMLAGLMGLYLTALVSSDATPNLLIPITTHTTYDFIAFLVVSWDYRKHMERRVDADT